MNYQNSIWLILSQHLLYTSTNWIYLVDILLHHVKRMLQTFLSIVCQNRWKLTLWATMVKNASYHQINFIYVLCHAVVLKYKHFDVLNEMDPFLSEKYTSQSSSGSRTISHLQLSAIKKFAAGSCFLCYFLLQKISSLKLLQK